MFIVDILQETALSISLGWSCSRLLSLFSIILSSRPLHTHGASPQTEPDSYPLKEPLSQDDPGEKALGGPPALVLLRGFVWGHFLWPYVMSLPLTQEVSTVQSDEEGTWFSIWPRDENTKHIESFISVTTDDSRWTREWVRERERKGSKQATENKLTRNCKERRNGTHRQRKREFHQMGGERVRDRGRKIEIVTGFIWSLLAGSVLGLRRGVCYRGGEGGDGALRVVWFDWAIVLVVGMGLVQREQREGWQRRERD